MRLLSGVAERLTEVMEAKAEADIQHATAINDVSELTVQVGMLKDALARAEARAAAAEARNTAVERTVAERVEETLQAAKAIVEAAETVRAETEQRAQQQSAVQQQMLQAAVARADAAEAELARRELLLLEFGQKAAELEAVKTELMKKSIHMESLEAEVAVLRLSRQKAQEEAVEAASRADIAQATVKTATQRLVSSARERVEAQLQVEKVRAQSMEAELASIKTEYAAAKAVADDAVHRMAVLRATIDRERGAHLNALAILEKSREEWKSRATALEAADHSGGQRPALAAVRPRGKSRLSGSTLRKLVASGPRIPERPRYSGEVEEEPPPVEEMQA
jgi:hypothetical protein